MIDTHTAHAPSANGNGRDTDGRFAKGNAGGTGNPFARQVAALRKALLESVTPEDVQAIIAAVIAKAKTGDVAAAKLVLGYTLGKPAATVDPDRLDVDEWQHFKNAAGMMVDLPKLLTQPVPDLPLTMVRATQPAASVDLSGRLGEMLRHPEKFHGNSFALQELLEGRQKAPSIIGSNGASTGRKPSTNRSNGKHGGPPESANGKPHPVTR